MAGSCGFKTTSIGIPTLLTWTASAVPATAVTASINVLDWIDIASPLADSQLDAVVNWITTESREAAGLLIIGLLQLLMKKAMTVVSKSLLCA